MKTLQKLVVLGASSPFTVELINCIKDSEILMARPSGIMLYGRNKNNLACVANYAIAAFSGTSWQVEYSDDIERALSGATAVIHQVRYGGLEGRANDETLAFKHGIAADETLGPSGLQSAIRMTPGLKKIARVIRAQCPSAYIINLTNPLSIAVSILHLEGIKNIFGLCELPWATLLKIAGILGVKETELEWQYTGLNHRGFIYGLKHNSRDVLADLGQSATPASLGGIDAGTILKLQAVPLKYFKLFISPKLSERRAETIDRLRNQILLELTEDPTTTPINLSKRNMDWYKYAVIPFLEAMQWQEPKTLVINTPSQDGITMERKMQVSASKVSEMEEQCPPQPVSDWLARFITHEKALLQAALEPSHSNIMQALRCDPLVPERKADPIRNAIYNYQNKLIYERPD